MLKNVSKFSFLLWTVLIMQTFTLASINLNQMQSKTKIIALNDFLIKSSIDVALLQEVAIDDFSVLNMFKVYNNFTPFAQGTAIACRRHLDLRNVVPHPTGRQISAKLGSVFLCKVYAPSGSQNRREREDFFSTVVGPELTSHTLDTILVGDFNCVIRSQDQNPGYNFSRALYELTQGLQLRDAWIHTNGESQGYTHITSNSASRIDRF